MKHMKHWDLRRVSPLLKSVGDYSSSSQCGTVITVSHTSETDVPLSDNKFVLEEC